MKNYTHAAELREVINMADRHNEYQP